MMKTIWKVLTRKKVLDPVGVGESQLARVLNTFDLTALGVGSTLGVGVYVLAGHVAKDTAGPAVIISFLIAAIASVFAGLCYAEFGARAPRAGSAYIYSYVCVGEFIAFIIGWNLILEYIIGSASVARGLSSYLDSLLNNTMNKTFIEIAPINVPYMSHYFDFFAFGVPLLLAGALAFGMKESSVVNNIFTILNICVVIFVIIAGGIKADPANWHIDPSKFTNTTGIGKGGFFPFGIEGVIKGAATCFYGFVGFDCIATTGEEVKNPKRAIPISIILSLLIIFLSYFGTSTVITLMVPYYMQDTKAPIPYAFEFVGWIIPKWIVAIGGIFGLCASLFGAMFPLPRIIYAMANDGLLFRFLGIVSNRFKTPVIGTLLAGLLTGLMAAMFELSQLVNMMSIGTLLAYTIVAASVLLLRYSVDKKERYMPVQDSDGSEDLDIYTENQNVWNEDTEERIESDRSEFIINEKVTAKGVIRQMFNYSRSKHPTKTTQTIVAMNICIYSLLCVALGLCAMYLKDRLTNGEITSIVIVSVVLFLLVLTIISILTQPVSKKVLSFKVPLVPLVPALSILFNIYLMLMLDPATWVRFGVWMAIGITIYIFCVSKCTSIDEKPLKTYTNSSYLPDELNTEGLMPTSEDPKQVNQPTKRKAPPPPDSLSNSVTILSTDMVLEKFDEMLDSLDVRNESVKSDVVTSESFVTSSRPDSRPFSHSISADLEDFRNNNTETNKILVQDSNFVVGDEVISADNTRVSLDKIGKPNITQIPPDGSNLEKLLVDRLESENGIQNTEKKNYGEGNAHEYSIPPPPPLPGQFLITNVPTMKRDDVEDVKETTREPGKMQTREKQPTYISKRELESVALRHVNKRSIVKSPSEGDLQYYVKNESIGNKDVKSTNRNNSIDGGTTTTPLVAKNNRIKSPSESDLKLAAVGEVSVGLPTNSEHVGALVTKTDIQSVKLKPVTRRPSLKIGKNDGGSSTSSSVSQSPESQVEHLVFGSREHKRLADKLNKQLRKGALKRSINASDMAKPVVVRRVSVEPVKNDDVDEEHISMSYAKAILAKNLKMDSLLPDHAIGLSGKDNTEE